MATTSSDTTRDYELPHVPKSFSNSEKISKFSDSRPTYFDRKFINRLSC